MVKHYLDEFVRQFRGALISREIYKGQQITREETLTDIQRAAQLYYLQKLVFVARYRIRTLVPQAPAHRDRICCGWKRI
ncbi:hypothetical protein [Nitrosomonas ureae]|uniref:hypothetical protein n=1 Tax=Nitrosomonas ureae TaxID=44577 RepID=UPI0011450908|nr:hypothetical protein [Nitrosomonas ureae]